MSSTVLSPEVDTGVSRSIAPMSEPHDGKYHLNKYPTYSNPQRHLERIKRDDNLRLMIASKFLLMTPYKGQYVRMLKNKKGKPVTFYHPKKANYVPGTINLTTWVLEQHLTYGGRFAVAVLYHDPYTIGATNIRWAMFDIDIPDFGVAKQAAMAIQNECSRVGLSSHISFSGGKGFHVELFFRSPGVTSADFHHFHQYIMKMCGVETIIQDVVEREKQKNPNSKPDIEARPEAGAGRPAKLPLAIHPKTGALAGYVVEEDGDLVEAADPYEYFLAIPFDNDCAIVRYYSNEWQAEARRRAVKEAEKQARAAALAQQLNQNQKSLEKAQRQSTSRNNTSAQTLKQQVEEIRAELASIVLDCDTLDTTSEVDRHIIESILENGLLPGKKRNDTTFLLVKLMRRYYRKDEAIAIVIPWIENVLYPKCRDHIEMPMEKHIVETRKMIERFWSRPPSGLTIDVHPAQIRHLVRYAKHKDTINLPKLRLLLAIFLQGEFAKKAGTASDDGHAPLAVKYLQDVTGMSPNVVLKYRDELVDEGVISLKPGTRHKVVRDEQGKGHLDKSSGKPQMIRVNVSFSEMDATEPPITLLKTMACQHNVCEWLLAKSFRPELKLILGGSKRHYKKWHGVIRAAEAFGH
ncbi:hypothetical protein JI721_12140 [Alicyclobacillus cycloheptanicus]|uniref:Uncharacterized protein n=1 Tax=Alicyclobacillus cycloheptanicus TaxID=1457 RepID=A0ABT9XLR9_9BACL|nr:hypothetical protein [Alicyclobacillus cycloheptanicus]MDQ0191256.1 hypothetical protein [Alicyclobacillus cycloheptanicus]WDM00466.1 hypothetical protein JI721_12140 [Alicyclobacillus cycloheptanicus]